MHIYDRVVEWDDSAGEAAFKNAKSRFWAEINGFTCDLSLPDPDVYIDDVDWDAEVDTELILDLEHGPDPIPEEEHVVILDALALSAQYDGQVWGTGWGDAEGINEDNVGIGKPVNSWDDHKCDGWNEDSWGIKEKTESWDHNNNSFKTESCYQKNSTNNNSFKIESWDQKKNYNNSRFKIESRDHNNSFKIKSWDHNNSNSFNQKKVEDRNSRDQAREGRGWRKRGEVRHGGEDCRWRNGRGRSRGGGFQQQSSGWGWTESF
ncbi:uncharacterized protein LOC17882013 isoform X2 [Capsella rubella]|nr:uncharacterized protein LOC17882013 isoform X2 [Capsella rubella]